MSSVSQATENSSYDRAKIGLALSGGGARGASHIGVIKVLEELRIPIDYIAGTSMGAVVGGLYASGMSSDEIEKQLGKIDWDDVFEDKSDRPDRSQRRKDDDKLYLSKAKAGITDAGINLPKAVILGQKFDQILKALTLPVADIKEFDSLPIPFRAVAMDIVTGNEVILKTGDLALAMHASMAIPVVFSPIELQGKLLVDGGAANNLPVSVVKEMGADIVIAIDISTPLTSRMDITGPLDVLAQLTGLLTRRNVEKQIEKMTETDLLITPDLGTISTMDFHRVSDAIEMGSIAAFDMKQQLMKLSISEDSYQDYLFHHAARDWDKPTISFIRFENNSPLAEQVLIEHFGVDTGQVLDLDKIELGIQAIYGLDIFESVRYDLVQENGNSGIIVYVEERSWGSDSLQAGLELSSDFTGQSSFDIALAYTKIPINKLNGELRFVLQLGENPAVVSEIYQPLDPGGRYFSHAALSWENQDTRIYSSNSEHADVEYELESFGLELAIGRNIGTWGEIRIGLARHTGEADVVVGSPQFSSFDFDDGYFFTRAKLDNIDNAHFPRTGYFSQVKWLTAKESLGSDQDYQQLQFEVLGAKSWGDNTLLSSVKYGSTIAGDVSIHNYYQLGGFMQLSGFEKNELSGQHFGLMSFIFQHRLYRSQYIPVYTGAAVQMGNIWQEKSDISADNLISSATLFLGADTPVGPFYLGYGVSEGGNSAVYLFLGQPFF